jgi:hypothetical protein
MQKERRYNMTGNDKVMEFFRDIDDFTLYKVLAVCPSNIGLKPLYNEYPKCIGNCAECYEYALNQEY